MGAVQFKRRTNTGLRKEKEMTPADTEKALENFGARLNFTTGPLELFDMIRNNEAINVIDVREPFDFALGHIPGALNLPSSAWDTSFVLTEDELNVVYSYSAACRLAAGASRRFAERGFDVAELEGGFERWQRHNLPTV